MLLSEFIYFSMFSGVFRYLDCNQNYNCASCTQFELPLSRVQQILCANHIYDDGGMSINKQKIIYTVFVTFFAHEIITLFGFTWRMLARIGKQSSGSRWLWKTQKLAHSVYKGVFKHNEVLFCLNYLTLKLY